jgi:hypothetical protein
VEIVLKLSNTKKAVVIYSLIMFVFMFMLCKSMVLHPNEYINTNGDGLKNTSTYLYHVQHDDKWWLYNGMNYPYGENILYTDGTPILSLFVKVVAKVIPSAKENALGFYHFFMLFTWWIGGLFLLLLFIRMHLPWWISTIASVGIILLNPQVPRMAHGHHALFHPLLPVLLFFWYVIFTSANKQWLYSGLVAALMLFFGLLHPYQFANAALVCGIMAIVFAMQQKGLKKLSHFLLIFFIQIIIPYLILLYFNTLANYCTDRPVAPPRFFIDRTFWHTLFLSHDLPLYNWIDKSILPLQRWDHENDSYLGLPATIFLFTTTATIVWQIIKRKINIWQNFNAFQKALFIVSIVSLLLSIGFPFILPGGNKWLFYTGQFRQIRSIGRFAWIAFFCLNILCISTLFKKEFKTTMFRNVIAHASVIILIFEGVIFSNTYPPYDLNIAPIKSSIEKAISNIKLDSFQAIIPQPYYHIGSENITQKDFSDILLRSFIFSNKTGMPNIGMMLSRTSEVQGIKSFNLFVLPYNVPEILKELPNNKPLLILESKQIKFTSDYDISWLPKNLKVVYEDSSQRFLALPLDIYKATAKKITDSLLQVFEKGNLKKIITNGAFVTTNKYAFIYENGKWQNDQPNNKHNIEKIILDSLQGKPMNVSVAFRTSNVLIDIVVRQYNKQGKLLRQYIENSGDFIKQISRISTLSSFELYPEKETTSLEIEVLNTEFELPSEIKSIWIADIGAQIFLKTNTGLKYNNVDLNLKGFE